MRGRRNIPIPVIDRFLKHVSPEPNSGCWLWASSINQDGYATFFVGRSVKAHRWAYEYFVGRIPVGLVLDHKCRVRSCVNPDHLRPVMPRENSLLGECPASINLAKTACPKGHPYSPENTRIYKNQRYCRPCRRVYSAAWRAMWDAWMAEPKKE